MRERCAGDHRGDRFLTLMVATYLWRDETRDNRGYTCGPDHVVALRDMVDKNISVPYTFCCGLGPGADEWAVHLEEHSVSHFSMDFSKHAPGTVYARLMQHRPNLQDWLDLNMVDAPHITRVLSLDIDLVVTGNIDHIVNRPEDIVLWRNPNHGRPGRAFYQSSVQLFTPGARPQLYDLFDPRTQRLPNGLDINWRFGGKEQAWISELLDWDEAFFDSSHGVYGAGRLGGSGVQSALPRNACIVSFPGSRAPWQYEVQEKHPWLKDHYPFVEEPDEPEADSAGPDGVVPDGVSGGD